MNSSIEPIIEEQMPKPIVKPVNKVTEPEMKNILTPEVVESDSSITYIIIGVVTGLLIIGICVYISYQKLKKSNG